MGWDMQSLEGEVDKLNNDICDLKAEVKILTEDKAKLVSIVEKTLYRLRDLDSMLNTFTVDVENLFGDAKNI